MGRVWFVSYEVFAFAILMYYEVLVPFLLKKKETTVKCNGWLLFNKVLSVLGAKTNPTRISKYGSVLPGNEKRKQGGCLTAYV